MFVTLRFPIYTCRYQICWKSDTNYRWSSPTPWLYIQILRKSLPLKASVCYQNFNIHTIRWDFYISMMNKLGSFIAIYILHTDY